MKYQPHNYQKYATQFIIDHPTAAVFLQMGLGKSVITLTAIQELALERFEVNRVLVIAPLRVARDTWPDEIQKWDHLHELTYSIAVGTEAERRAALHGKNCAALSCPRRLLEILLIPADLELIAVQSLLAQEFPIHRFKVAVSRLPAQLVGNPCGKTLKPRVVCCTAL